MGGTPAMSVTMSYETERLVGFVPRGHWHRNSFKSDLKIGYSIFFSVHSKGHLKAATNKNGVPCNKPCPYPQKQASLRNRGHKPRKTHSF